MAKLLSTTTVTLDQDVNDVCVCVCFRSSSRIPYQGKRQWCALILIAFGCSRVIYWAYLTRSKGKNEKFQSIIGRIIDTFLFLRSLRIIVKVLNHLAYLIRWFINFIYDFIWILCQSQILLLNLFKIYITIILNLTIISETCLIILRPVALTQRRESIAMHCLSNRILTQRRKGSSPDIFKPTQWNWKILPLDVDIIPMSRPGIIEILFSLDAQSESIVASNCVNSDWSFIKTCVSPILS